MENHTWRCSLPTRVLLVRHGEALKNLADRHGGPGTRLTEKGLAEASLLGARIVDHGIGDARIVCHGVPHVEQTAAAIVESTGWSLLQDERLKGIDLGLLAGMSRKEAFIADSAAAERLDLWRAGKLRIDRLGLPGAEDVDAFRRRVSDCLAWAVHPDGQPVVIVGTRSTFIMMMNLLRMAQGFSYEHYVPYDFANASLTAWGLSEAEPALIAFNTVAEL